jgi:colanic acid biosynthesis glycosyl transferase WcaI
LDRALRSRFIGPKKLELLAGKALSQAVNTTDIAGKAAPTMVSVRGSGVLGSFKLSMQPIRAPGKVVVVSQYYAPDQSTTAAIMTSIATHVAKSSQVLVVSGKSGLSRKQESKVGQPEVLEIRNSMPEKTALSKRALFEFIFSVRSFITLFRILRRGDVVLTVTAPFMLPYAVAAATRLRGARSILILHDLYPDVLVMAGVLQPTSIITKIIHAANAIMFRGLNIIITIGRDTEKLLLCYKHMTSDKIVFIPNWATLTPGVRPIVSDNIYRASCKARFVVGMSGNLGFTHDPDVVFDAALQLQDDSTIHFLLSGWGMGFERLKARQAEAHLANLTLVDRVPEQTLEEFLSAADIWIIPYRKNVAGVSVPSRFYNLLAVGRPVLIVSEPDAEAALTVSENDLGWVVSPGDAAELAKKIRIASSSEEIKSMGLRAAAMAEQFNEENALTKYQGLVETLLQKAEQ